MACKEVIAAAGPKATDIKLKVSEAGVFGRKREFDRAHALLDEAEALMEGLTPGGTPAKGPEQAPEVPVAPTEPGARWAKRLEATDEVFQRVLKLNPPNATALRAVMSYATEQAEAGQHAKALAALDRLDGLLAAAEASPTKSSETGYTGLVEYRKTLLEFRKATEAVSGQRAALKSKIGTTLPDETELAEELEEKLGELTEDLLDAVNEAMSAAENEASPVTKTLIDQLKAYAQEVSTNKLVKHVDSNTFAVPVSVGKTLGDALKKILQAMPAAA